MSGQDSIWLQNTKAWARMMREISAQGANILFFNGDMIMGYGNAIAPADASTVDKIISSDLVGFYRQYAYWRGMVATLMENGTYVIPVPGNHETQWKAAGKKAQPANENAWRANMGDLIFDDSRFMSLLGSRPSFEDTSDHSGLDGLTSDQSKLSYSFDFQGFHFTVINTDPTGSDSHAPINWLQADLAAAKGRGVRAFFVFGHKPAFTYYYTGTLPATPAGLDVDTASRDLFWSTIEQYGAIYFCGHEHIFNLTQPTSARGGSSWQILVGTAGSPFEAAPTITTFNPSTDRDYAWATVKVHQSGRIKLTAYGFDDHYGPTRVVGRVAN
jgi:hypothetical protein